LIVVLVVLVAVDYAVYRDRVHRGVAVWGIRLDGLQSEALFVALGDIAAERLNDPLTLASDAEPSVGSKELEIVPARAGLGIDTMAMGGAALRVGRGPFVDGLVARVRTWFAEEPVETVFVVDETAWRATLDTCALAFERLPKEAGLTIVEGFPKAIAGEYGYAIDEEQFLQALQRAVDGGEAKVSVPLRRTEPRVTTEAAQVALSAAQVALSGPLLLTHRDLQYVLSVDDIARMMRVNASGIAAGRPITFSANETVAELQELLVEVEQPPVEAEIVPRDDGRGFDILESRAGTAIQWEALLASMERAAGAPARRIVAIPTTVAPPKLSTEDAEQLALRRPVASFRTFFSPANAARSNNIRQVAAILDGRVVAPGETFSFNTAVGPRTQAAGFDEAPVISGGVLTPGVGGGICQVSTTLFNAVFFAGLPVVERWPHSFHIDHYPMGRDATVSYGSQDFRFRNDTDQMLLMSVTAGEGWVEVVLAAPSWSRTVDYRTIQVGELMLPVSSAEKPRLLQDPSLPVGSRSDLEEGVPGRSTAVTRFVHGPDGQLLVEDLFESVYAPKDYIVRVGV
jgi:vancomycin resistance protein YoaR